jgi:hypothetical protein
LLASLALAKGAIPGGAAVVGAESKYVTAQGNRGL